jgi:hypothetical protein
VQGENTTSIGKYCIVVWTNCNVELTKKSTLVVSITVFVAKDRKNLYALQRLAIFILIITHTTYRNTCTHTHTHTHCMEISGTGFHGKS